MVGESLVNTHTKLHGKLENVQLNNSYVRDQIKNLQKPIVVRRNEGSFKIVVKVAFGNIKR